MSLSSDEFDGDIRQPLYDIQSKLTDIHPHSHAIRLINEAVTAAIGLADDHRIDLMDEEDEANELFMKQHEADDLGDAKLEEQRSER